MEQVPRETSAAFERRLEQAGVPLSLRAAHHKWVRFYLDFCHKYRHPPDAPTSLGPFLAKLASKNQSPDQRHQASVAVRLLTEAGPAKDRSLQVAAANPVAGEATPGTGQSSSARSRPVAQPPRPKPVERMTPQSAAAPWRSVTTARSSGQGRPAAPLPRLEGERSGSHGSAAEQAAANASGASWEQEYRDLEGAIRLRNYSSKTLEAYRLWVVKFQAFVRSRPTGQLSGQEVRGFLTDLAVRHGVAASTQNQAFNALLFFYRHVLGREFGKLEGVVRAKRRPYVPVVLSRSEMDAVLSQLPPPHRLVGLLLYGCGLRLAECLGLRIHCFNLDAMLLTVHDGKGQKDRTVPLPVRALPEIREQIAKVRRLHAEDLAAGSAGVFLPRQLEKKYKNAAKEFLWQWFFPAAKLTWIASAGEWRRYHLHDTHVQAEVKQAAARAAILKRVSPHIFRHTYASHLLLAKYDLQTIQRLLGHSDIKTTMIYLQTVPNVTLREAKSPLDCAD